MFYISINKYVNSEYFLSLLEDEEGLSSASDFLHCQGIAFMYDNFITHIKQEKYYTSVILLLTHFISLMLSGCSAL